MALKGTNALVQVSTSSGGTYTTVAQMKQAQLKFQGNNVDISKFGDTFMSRLQGLKDASYSLNGFYDPTDTLGQLAIRGAWNADTVLWVKFLYDGTNGWKQQVVVNSFDVSAAVAGVQDLSIAVSSAGGAAPVAVP